MFGKSKPKGWEDLSPEDQSWYEQNKDTKVMDLLLDCAKNNQAARIRFLLKIKNPGKGARYRLALTAAESGAAEALQILLEKYKFVLAFEPFEERSYKDRERVKTLFATASSREALEVLYNINSKGEWGSIPLETILQTINYDNPSAEYFTFFIGKAPRENTWIFEEIVNSACNREGTGLLQITISAAHKFNNTLSILHCALLTSVEKTDAEKTILLLKSGILAPRDSLTVLNKMILTGNVSFLKETLPIFAENTATPKTSILQCLVGAGIDSRIAPTLVEKIPATAAENIQPAASLSKEEYDLVSTDTLSRTQHLRDMMLTTVFNFTLRQQTQIVVANGTMTSPAVLPFHDIDREVVEAMHKKLVDLGGKAENPCQLSKPAPGAR